MVVVQQRPSPGEVVERGPELPMRPRTVGEALEAAGTRAEKRAIQKQYRLFAGLRRRGGNLR